MQVSINISMKSNVKRSQKFFHCCRSDMKKVSKMVSFLMISVVRFLI